MGNSCKGESSILEINQLRIQKLNEKEFQKSNHQSNRFHGQIQKLKSNSSTKYKLILPIDSSYLETRTIQMDFLFSYSDLQLYQPYLFQLMDNKLAPILDHFQKEYQQIYHKIQFSGKIKSLKYYNFQNIQDYSFKSGLYQLSVNLALKSSPIQNFFVIHRSQQKQLVMICKYFQASLHDVLLFRKATNFFWTQKQILVIAKMIINSYRSMSLNKIIHRDIRPSNIFFCPQSSTNNKQSNVYEIINLSSARFYQENFQNQQTQMLTLKGVPVFASNQVKTGLESGQCIMAYDAIKLDIEGIQNTLFCLINLNIYNKEHNMSKCSGKLKELMQYFKNPQISIQKLNQKIQNLVGTSSIFGEQLLQRDRSICQNIQKKLYFNCSQTSQLLNQIYINSMFDLHKKDVFVPHMMHQINKNYEKNNNKRANINIFLKLGDYFSKNGVKDNQYYRQAVRLFLDILVQQRVSGFYLQHSQTLKQAQQVNLKLQFQNQSNKSIKALYLKQKAYQIYYTSTLSEGQKAEESLKNINQAISIFSRSKNVSVQEQLDVLFAKGQLQLMNRGSQFAQPYFQEGLQISSESKNFKSKSIYNFYKGLFQYGVATSKISHIKTNPHDAKAKDIAKIQDLLNKAKQRFESVSIPVIYLIRCFIGNSDLYYLRQNFQTSKKMSQRALTLLDAQNQQKRQISEEIQLLIIDRLILILDKQDKYKNEYGKYIKKKQELKKMVRGQNKRSKKSRKDKQRDSSRLIRRQTNKQNKEAQLGIIQQQQQIKQLVQSKKKYNRQSQIQNQFQQEQ